MAPAGAFLANNAMAVWPKDESELSLGFLSLLLQTADLRGEGVISGQVQPQITRRSLDPLRVPIPSLDQQQRIVDLTDSVDAVLGAAMRTAVSARVLLSAVEAEAVAAPDALRPLGEVTSFAGGYAFPEVRQGHSSGDLPFLKVSDMNGRGKERVLTGSANYISRATAAEMRVRTWPAGTVIFPKVGAALLTEKRRILGVEAAFDNNIMGLVPGEDLLPDYLLAFMRTVRLGDRAQPGAVPSINQSHVRDIQIPVLHLEDQAALVDLVGRIGEFAVTAEHVAESLQHLRIVLLDHLSPTSTRSRTLTTHCYWSRRERVLGVGDGAGGNS
jgi:type I restriction enzyme S subunit